MISHSKNGKMLTYNENILYYQFSLIKYKLISMDFYSDIEKNAFLNICRNREWFC